MAGKNDRILNADDIATADDNSDQESIDNKIIVLNERIDTLERMLFRILDGLELDYPGIGYGT